MAEFRTDDAMQFQEACAKLVAPIRHALSWGFFTNFVFIAVGYNLCLL